MNSGKFFNLSQLIRLFLIDLYISLKKMRFNSVHSLHKLTKSSILLNFTACSVDGFRATHWQQNVCSDAILIKTGRKYYGKQPSCHLTVKPCKQGDTSYEAYS